ncbi:50S ribosomal protein L11 [Candidatus Woesearchaeota archaeon]|nr:50S ribosomal protein L11 [Candidatus Woesearchaeota archaeon]
MSKETVEALVSGGKATAAPPLGPALGPLGVNIGLVVAEINKKTASFQGMQVPVKVTVDTSTKEFSISVGTPPASALLKKEAKVEKGAGNPKTEKVADLKIEQIIKIALMKQDALTGKTLKEKVKEIIGTCFSMGILVEGVPAKDAFKLVNEGKFDQEIKEERTELSAAELKMLEEERLRLEKELKERREEFLKKAQATIKEMEGKEKNVIRKKLEELAIPMPIIRELLPEEKAAPGAAPAKKK